MKRYMTLIKKILAYKKHKRKNRIIDTPQGTLIEVDTIETRLENNTHKMLSRDVYTPIGASITNTYSFQVRPGYRYFKIWVKALKDSDDIVCTVLKDSPTDSPVTKFTVLKGTSDFDVVDCEAGTYYIIFTSSGNMNGQYNVKVGTSVNDVS